MIQWHLQHMWPFICTEEQTICSCTWIKWVVIPRPALAPALPPQVWGMDTPPAVTPLQLSTESLWHTVRSVEFLLTFPPGLWAVNLQKLMKRLQLAFRLSLTPPHFPPHHLNIKHTGGLADISTINVLFFSVLLRTDGWLARRQHLEQLHLHL